VKIIRGRTAVVTGAGGGIGRSIAMALAKEGAVVNVADIDGPAATAVAREVVEAGGRATAYTVDVSQLASVEAMAEAIYAELGSVEILVNNAGVTMRPFRASWDTSYEDFRWMMDVNFFGVLHGHYVFVPRMRQTPGEKHIVNTSSMASLRAFAGHSAYSASKSAVDGLSRAAREELKTQNIGVTLLHPGAVRTRIVTSERLRAVQDRSEARDVRPWSSYLTGSLPTYIAEGAEPDTRDDPEVAQDPSEYMLPDRVGDMVVEGIKTNKPHVLTHPAPVAILRAGLDDVIAGAPAPRVD